MKINNIRLLTAFPRGLIIGIEILAVLSVIVSVGLIYILFRLSQGPIDVAFARVHIEQALSSKDHSVEVRVGQAHLSWSNLTGPLRLDLDRLDIERDGTPFLAVADLSLTLAKAPLLIGQIRPERLILRSPLLTLNRDLNNNLSLVFPGGLPATEPKGNESGRALISFLMDDTQNQTGIFSRVREIGIEHAQLRVVDERAGMTWRLNDVDLSFRAVDVGLYGSMNVQLPNAQMFSLVTTYHRARDELTVTSNFRDFSLAVYAGRLFGIDALRRKRLPLTGSFELKGNLKTLSLTDLALNAIGTQGLFDTRSLLGIDLPVSGLRMNVQYTRSDAKWTLNDLAFNVNQIPVRATGDLSPDEKGNYKGALDMKVDQIALETVQTLWPDDLRDTPLGEWITQKLSGATINDLHVSLPLWAGRKERQLTLLMLRPTAEFSFENLDADYRPPLTPITSARGSGTYKNDDLSFDVQDAKIKDITIGKGSTIVINDVARAGAGLAQLHLVLSGPLSTVLHYITLDPIHLGNKLPISPETAKGTGTYTTDISFPTVHDLPASDVEVSVAATLQNVELPKLVKGQTLSGGPFDLTIDKGRVGMKGSGKIGGRPATIHWEQPIDLPESGPVMAISAQVESDNALRQAFGADLPFLQGSVPIDLKYTELANGQENVEIDADVTPARVRLETLRYEKAAGSEGRARLTLSLKNGVPDQAKNLNVDLPNLKIETGTLNFGMIDGAIDVTRATLPHLKLGQTEANALYARQQGRMDITLTGKKIDLAPFMDSKGDDTTAPTVTLKAQADSLTFGGKDDLKKATMRVDLNARADLERLELAGTAGNGPASIHYVPDAQGRMTFDVQARDAGAFLRVMNVYDNMVDGTLSLRGSPIGTNNRDVKGDLLIKDFSVVKAPVLAQLLGGMSLQGVGEQLENKGIVFTRLESGFAWVRRPTQDIMTFREGRTSGSALGITFDGLYDRHAGNIEITGTLIPLSGLNKFAGSIPLLGQLLTGGKGSALFAATYSIKGPTEKPQTLINPLSVLTPGILRRILFESSPGNGVKTEAEKTPPRGAVN